MDKTLDGLAPLESGEKVKIAICLPHYAGPDIETVAEYFSMMGYFGRLQEQSHLKELVIKTQGLDAWKKMHAELPKLDDSTTLGELQDDDPVFSFTIVNKMQWSLPGQAREFCVEEALALGCDYCFFFDDDMRFARDTFLRLYRHQKQVVFGLAFTSREPILPVVYKFNRTTKEGVTSVDMDHVFDFPEDTLFQCDAHGTGVCLIHADAFRKIGKGWFNAQGSGEDIHFCVKCEQNNIPIFCDSSVFIDHKSQTVLWHNKNTYRDARAIYKNFEQRKLVKQFELSMEM